MSRKMFLFILCIFLCSIIKAEPPYTVEIGKNWAISECNQYGSKFEYTQIYPGKRNPAIMKATSDGKHNIASTHLLAKKHQGGRALTNVAVNFVVSGNSGEEREAYICFTYHAAMDMKFDVPPPSQEGGGSCHVYSRAFFLLDGERVDFPSDELYAVHNSNSGNFYRVRKVGMKAKLKPGGNYILHAEVYSHGDVYGGGIADASGAVTFLKAEVLFQDETERCDILPSSFKQKSEYNTRESIILKKFVFVNATGSVFQKLYIKIFITTGEVIELGCDDLPPDYAAVWVPDISIVPVYCDAYVFINNAWYGPARFQYTPNEKGEWIIGLQASHLESGGYADKTTLSVKTPHSLFLKETKNAPDSLKKSMAYQVQAK